jgi:hypothetical protein
MTQGWGTNGKAGSHAAGRLWTRRIGITLLVTGLAACLLWLLVRPLLHPRTHLVLLTGSITGTTEPGEAPADFVLEDFRALIGLRGVLHRSIMSDGGPLILGSLQNQDEMQHLADRMNERLSGRNDVVILYVSAHGFTQDGDAWLLASGADPHSPLGGRYRLASLLAQLRECQAETKILLLDAGRLEYDPLRGLVENDFPTRLVEQVEQLGDPNLWVLVSHGDGERSHLSPSWRRSIFGNYVATGLSGAADENEDQVVDVAELTKYVHTNVSGFVRQTTGGSAQQTPQIAWGGGSLDQSGSPVLLAVARPEKQSKSVEPTKAGEVATNELADSPDNRAQQEATDKAERELNSLIVSGISRSTPGGRLGHYANEAARRALAKTFGSLMPKEESGEAKAPEEKKGQAETADAKQADAKQANDKSGADGKDSTSNDSKNDGPKSKASADTTKETVASQSKGESTVSRQDLEKSLNRAWQVRDELASADRASARPLDYAPSIWRELEQRLLIIDRKTRMGFLQNAEELNVELQVLLGNLDAIASGKPAEDFPPESIGRKLVEALPGLALSRAKPRSLALAEVIAREGGRSLSPNEKQLIAGLDELIARGNRTDLEKLAKELQDEAGWYELSVVHRIAARADLDWRLIQLLLDGLRRGERAAANVRFSGPNVQPRIEAADALWISAQRRMLYSPSFDRDAILGQLIAARDAYQDILNDLNAFQSAKRLASDVRLRLPDYLAWNAASSADEFGPSDAALLELFAKLAALETELDSTASDNFVPIEKAAAALTASREAVDQPSEPVVIERLLSMPVSPGESWKIQLLLETPLLTAAERQALQEVVTRIDAALIAEVKPPAATPAFRWPKIASMPDDSLFAARMQLARRWFEMLTSGTAPAGSTNLARRDRLTSNTSKTGPIVGARALRDLECRQLQDLLRDLPSEIELAAAELADLSNPASRDSHRAQLRRWKGVLSLIDPRQNDHLSMTSVAALNNANAYDLLVWLSDRAGRAIGDAPPQDAALSREVMTAYRLTAETIPRQPSLRGAAHDALEISGPDVVTLTYLPREELNFRVRNLTSSHHSVWLAVDLDDQLVQAASGNLRTIYSWSELSSGGSTSANSVNLLDVVRQRPPSLQLAPGQSAVAPLRITRRGASNHPSHLVLRAIAADSVARYDVTVKLPPPQDITLTVAGPVTRWSSSASGIELLPFPNRNNLFAFEIANGKPDERKIDVDLFPVLSLPASGVPSVPLSEADAQRLRAEITLGPIVAEAKNLTISGGGRPMPIPFKKPEEVVPVPAAAPAAAAPKAPAADKPPPTPLPQGLLAIVTDQATKQQTFRQLNISPQRPQRYVRAQVRYRAGRERIEIRVSPQEGAILPASGVRIHGDLAEPIPSEAERQLDAVLKPGESEAELFVDVDSTSGDFVTLRLTIDDYPRAMYFRVPIGGETSDLPEDLDLLSIRVTELPDGIVYKQPVGTVPVQVAIDAPASGSRNPPLRVEVGLDQNRDRELKGDQTVLLTTDRQVTASLVGVTKLGELEINTKVSDFIVNVPAAGLGSGRMNVLAHSVFGDKDAWSDPIEVSLDGLPPRVSAIELRPSGTVVIGDPVLVSVMADDAGLSGVAKVEAAFDLDRSGKLGAAPPPTAGALGDDGRWTIAVPTAGLSSGTYNILVRATDKAGNEGQSARAPVRLASAEQAEADAKKTAAADITGVVNYGPEPQAGVPVSLLRDIGPLPPTKKSKKNKNASPPPTPLAQAVTDAKGQFRFPKIAPGKYIVTATALIHNKHRDAEAPVAFTKPDEVQPVTLSLK